MIRKNERSRNNYFHLKSISIILVLFLFIVCTGIPKANAQREKGVEYEGIDGMKIVDPDLAAGFRKYDRITVEVNITSGGPVDIYLLKESEYKKLEENVSFKASISKEHVNHTRFKWEKPDDKTYYLVIDNKDNAHTNDAVPISDVTYNYTADIEERHNDVIRKHMVIVGVIIAIVIIIVTIVAIIFIIKRR